MVTRSEQLATIGLSLADLVLEVFCFAAAPSFKAVATLVATARQAVNDVGTSSPEFVKDRSMLSKRVIEVLTKKVKAAREQCLDRGIDASLLAQAESAVAALISTDAEEDLVVLSAVRDPEGFEKFFTTRAAKHRQQIEEQSEPYFDALVRAVAATYVEIAPWSDSFVVSALKSMLDEFTGMKEQMTIHHMEDLQLFDQILQLLQSLAEAIEELRKPSHTKRVNFGSRPDVVVGGRFVERDEHKQLKAVITDPTRHQTVLLGMRGCGKTQLAASLARQCENANWNLVAWINAVSRESIQSDLVELAKRLKIDTSDLPTQDEVICRCLNHLQSVGPADRLIVFDNVEDINHLTGLIPSGDGVRVVATTTNKVGWEDQGWNSIRVGVFDRSTSIEYLLTVTNSDDREAADTLAERLGDLPVAVAQAAATARNKDLSLARYLQRLESRGEELVIRPIPGDEYTDDVATVLWMAAEDEDAHDALTELIHRSIVQQSTDRSTTMLHRLQAQVLRESWDKVEYAQARESAVSLLGAVDIDKFRGSDTESRRRETLDLIEALRAIGEQTYSRSLLSEQSISTILKHTLPHAHYLGLDYEALSLGATIALICEIFGYEHPDTISLRFHFAESCQSAGKVGDAITLYQEVLSTSQQVLSPSHQSTLAALNGLSCAYFSAGHLTVAIPMFEQVLSARIKVLGPNHPDTLRTRGNLAVALHNVGDLDNAIALQEQVVSESRRILGPHHTDTFTFAINLADTYHSARRLDDAIQYYEELSTEASNYLGYNHPITLTALNNLASVYESAEMFDSAIALYEEVVALRTRFIGPNHIDTLTSRSNLAGGYESVGRLDEAIALYEQILQDSQHSLGPKHPETIGTKANLAHAYHIAHRISDALSLYEDALATSTDTLGAEHPETLHVQHSLATVFESSGDLTTALSLYEQVFSERERLLSFEHPDTLITANDLANAYSSAGRFQEAIDLHERVFKTRVHLLDVDHPDTLTSGTYLAYAYLTSGHVIEAISLYRELLDVAMDALGPEHTLTQTLHNHVTTLMTAMSTQGEALDEH